MIEKGETGITQYDYFNFGLSPNHLPSGSEVKLIEIDELVGSVAYLLQVLKPKEFAGQTFHVNANSDEASTLVQKK